MIEEPGNSIWNISLSVIDANLDWVENDKTGDHMRSDSVLLVFMFVKMPW